MQFAVGLGIAVNGFPRHVGRGGLHGIGNNGAHFVGQSVVFGFVEGDFKLLSVLVVALQHADLGDIGKAQSLVRTGVVELGSIKQTAVHGRNDFATWQGVDSSAHGGENIDRDTHGAVLQAFEIFWFGDRLFEPAQRLRGVRRIGKRHHIGANGCIHLGQQLLAATILVPGQQHVGVHAKARPRAPQCQRILFAIVVDQHPVPAIQRAFGHRVKQAKGGNH